MLTKAITYTDIDDVSQTETYCFQISLPELTLEIYDEDKKGRTLKDRIEKMSSMTKDTLKDERSVVELMNLYKDIIKQAVGKRKGQLFVKNEEVQEQFLYSGAYEAMFMEIMNTPDSGAQMISAMMPSSIRGEVDKMMVAKAKELGVDIPGAPVEGEVLPSSGTVEQVAQPAAAASTGTDDDTPLWFRENRYATPKEMMKAGPEEVRLAMKMKSDKAFG